MTPQDYKLRSQIAAELGLNSIVLNDRLAQLGIIQCKSRKGLRTIWLITEAGQRIARVKSQSEFALHFETVKGMLQTGCDLPAEQTTWKDRQKAPDEFMTRNQISAYLGLSAETISRMLERKGYLAKDTNRNRKSFTLTQKGLEIGRHCKELGTFLLNAQSVQKVLDLHLAGGAA